MVDFDVKKYIAHHSKLMKKENLLKCFFTKIYTYWVDSKISNEEYITTINQGNDLINKAYSIKK